MMSASTPVLAQTYRRLQRVLSASVGDEIVMMSVEKGQYYNLNAVGGRIWRLLETPQRLDQIVTTLADVYEAPEDTIRAEADAFLARLKREGLLEIVTTDAP
jgi:hypothetical protein